MTNTAKYRIFPSLLSLFCGELWKIIADTITPLSVVIRVTASHSEATNDIFRSLRIFANMCLHLIIVDIFQDCRLNISTPKILCHFNSYHALNLHLVKLFSIHYHYCTGLSSSFFHVHSTAGSQVGPVQRLLETQICNCRCV